MKPQPYTPSNCDLRSFPYIPVDINRLLDSQFHAMATEAEWRAGFILWLKAFHQLPAGSLPKDADSLARLAELKQGAGQWKALKKVVLRGWVECADGRLYHRVVAEKVLEAWVERLKSRRRGTNGNAKRWEGKAKLTEIDDALVEAIPLLAALNPQSKPLEKLPPEILVRLREDCPVIAEGSREDRVRIVGRSREDRRSIAEGSRDNRKVEAIPSGYPSQEDENPPGEVIPHPRAGAHANGGAR